jgi:hypothetical protein
MKRLEIKETNNTPHILFDVTTGVFVIEGKSFPEDSKEFYRPLIEWFDGLIAAKSVSELTLTFNLFYLSSSSIISVKQLLMKLIDLSNNGAKVNVLWKYDDDDDDIKKTGEDYQKITKLQFDFQTND